MKLYHSKMRKCSDGKHSKERFTLLLAVNMIGITFINRKNLSVLLVSNIFRLNTQGIRKHG